ncbi:MAG: AsmA family protein [Cyclobacteriaceae bacterium]|nr:AsmA family protein [Cyclobacteriaceae bacterium]
MKKFLIISASIIGIFFLIVITVPFIFKDRIKEEISKALDDALDAEILFNPSKFRFSLLRHFPNPTASLGDFGIRGKNIFANDTLIFVRDFEIVIDLFSLLGDNPTIQSIYLHQPFINIKVLKDGQANYYIVKDDGETEETTESGTELSIAIKKWHIHQGRIIYDDKTLDYFMDLKGVYHTGSGDFSLDVFDMTTQNDIEQVIVVYDGVKYLNKQRVRGDATINMDLSTFTFTFKDNRFLVNDFPLSFEGYITMPEDDIGMDLTFSSKDGSIKSIYSLVPGVYTDGFESIAADGSMSFNGRVNGVYSDTSMPAFHVQLLADNGSIQYPGLPEAIRNINIDMEVLNSDGVIDNTRIDIRKFNMDFGANPVKARLLIKNLLNYDMDADIQAKINLQEMNKMFPMEGLNMRGMLDMTLKASGIYDSVRNIIPRTNFKATLREGYVKSNELPKAIDQLSLDASFICETGKMQDGRFELSSFLMKMGDDALEASLLLQNLTDYTWDLKASGSLDLGVISEYYPSEGMNYKGKLLANLETRGRYSDVEAGRYDRFPTSGFMELNNFYFQSVDLPNAFEMPTSKLIFNPQSMEIQGLKATMGSSDFAVEGQVSNYIAYIFKDEVIKGSMRLNSQRLDINELMTGEESSEEDTTRLEVIEVPTNIDFEFSAEIGKIFYDNLSLNDAKGKLIVRDGIINMQDLRFGLLGGNIAMNGIYDPRNPALPVFNYNMEITRLSIPSAFTSFSTVQKFAPFSQFMNGDFNSKFSINGVLGQDMMPKLETLTANGIIEIADAYMKQTRLVSGITSLTRMSSANEDLQIKDLLLSFGIKDGRASVRPFDLKIANQVATIDGSVGLDGSLRYAASTEVPAGVAGQLAGNLLAGITGSQNLSADTKLRFNIGIGGTYADPKFSLLSVTTQDGQTVQQEVREEIRAEADRIRDEAEVRVREEANRIAEEARDRAQPQIDSARQIIDEKVQQQQEELKKETEKAKEQLKDLFKRRSGSGQ